MMRQLGACIKGELIIMILLKMLMMMMIHDLEDNLMMRQLGACMKGYTTTHEAVKDVDDDDDS